MKMADSFPTEEERRRREEGVTCRPNFYKFPRRLQTLCFFVSIPHLPPVNFQTFFGERIILCFLERNEELQYCLTEQCWIKKGISCLRHEGFCIFNGIAFFQMNVSSMCVKIIIIVIIGILLHWLKKYSLRMRLININFAAFQLLSYQS